jgi:exodeoxyribonuclease V
MDHEIMDAIEESYSNLGHEETSIIVRSNKRANLYNEQIRSQNSLSGRRNFSRGLS